MTGTHVIPVLAVAVAALTIVLFFRTTRYSRLLFWTLSCLLLGLLFHAEAWKKPVSSDGYYYYVWVVSAWFDHDLDLTNNYAACGNPYGFGLTRTGYGDTVFPVGCAVLWLPFFAVGQCLRMLPGLHVDAPSGLSLLEQRATMVGTLVYGMTGLILLLRVCRRASSERTAFFSLSCMLWGTFLAYYLTSRPSMSEGCSFFTQSLFLFLIMRARPDASWKDSVLLGLVLGLSAAVRYHNLASLCLVAPLFLAWRNKQRWGGEGLSTRIVAFVVGLTLGFLPQIYVLIRLYGWPPTLGSGARLVGISNIVDLPSVLLSPDHGLIYWHPIAALGIAGLASLQRSKVWLDKCMLLAFLLHLAANSIGLTMGAAFGARRFAGALPLLALGLSHLLDQFCAVGYRWRRILTVGVAVPLVLWNLFIWTTLGHRPRQVADLAATAHPSPRDRPSGTRRTIYLGRQRGEPGLLQGWGPVQTDGDLSYRAMTADEAFVTLHLPAHQDLLVTIRARSLGAAPCQVRILLGRSEVAVFQVSNVWEDHEFSLAEGPRTSTQKLRIVGVDKACRSVAVAWLSLVRVCAPSAQSR